MGDAAEKLADAIRALIPAPQPLPEWVQLSVEAKRRGMETRSLRAWCLARGDTRGPKEFVYDTAIYPLMSQVIELARGAGIAMLFDAELEKPAGSEYPTHVTTMLGDPTDIPSKLARAALDPRGPAVLLATLMRLKDGG